jgi:CHAD domain-containing protein
MIRKSKWVEGARPEMPVSAAARQVLSDRLHLCWYYLPLASESYTDDVEYVHQLRVSTRRAVAAVEIFSQVLPERRGRKMLRWLKKARRAAGPARDDDVLAAQLNKLAKKKESRSTIQGLLEQVEAHRAKSQAAIDAFYEHSLKKDAPARIEKILDRIKWRSEGSEPSFRAAGDTYLQASLAEFKAVAAGDLRNAEPLHALRIAGKQLRYAMEVFHEAYPPKFRSEIYPLVEQLQDALGVANDHATASERFVNWHDAAEDKSTSKFLRALANRHREEFDECRAGFLAWWNGGGEKELTLGLRKIISK